MSSLTIFAPLRRIASAAALFVVAGGCGGDSLAPFQPEVVNTTDSFSAQATGVTHVTTNLTWTWANTGTTAIINHSTTTTGGTILLVVKDASNTTVYSKALAPSLNEATSVGVAGNWKIELTLTNYSGTLNFTAQKG